MSVLCFHSAGPLEGSKPLSPPKSGLILVFAHTVLHAYEKLSVFLNSTLFVENVLYWTLRALYMPLLKAKQLSLWVKSEGLRVAYCCPLIHAFPRKIRTVHAVDYVKSRTEVSLAPKGRFLLLFLSQVKLALECRT